MEDAGVLPGQEEAAGVRHNRLRRKDAAGGQKETAAGARPEQMEDVGVLPGQEEAAGVRHNWLGQIGEAGAWPGQIEDAGVSLLVRRLPILINGVLTQDSQMPSQIRGYRVIMPLIRR
jgi:hypothetical protein